MFSSSWFSDLAQGISALAIAVAAWLGVLAWKSQTVGRRKVEVAEEALTSLNQIAEKFSVFRVAFREGDAALTEMLSKIPPNGIPGRQEVTLQHDIQVWLKPHFERVNEIRPLAQTYFGESALRPFLTLNEAINSLKKSAMLLDSDSLEREQFRKELANLFQGNDKETECSVLLARLRAEADSVFGEYLRKI